GGSGGAERSQARRPRRGRPRELRPRPGDGRARRLLGAGDRGPTSRRARGRGGRPLPPRALPGAASLNRADIPFHRSDAGQPAVDRERAPPSAEPLWALRHGLPEFRVVTEHDAYAARLHLAKPPQHGQGRLPVGDDAGRVKAFERLPEVAGVPAEHELAVRRADAQRLVAGRVAVGRQADNGAVAEEVVLALDLPGPLTGVEVDLAIAGIVVRERHGVTPFASLNDYVGVGKLRVPAAMVVVKMRVHDAGDLLRRDGHGRQTR